MGRDYIENDRSITRYRVIGEYLGVRTSDNNLFLFYKPSFMGLYVKSHVRAGIGLFIFGLFMLGVSYALGNTGVLPKALADILSILLFIFGLSFIIGGIILALWRERSLLIETHAGTLVWFRNSGITDRDVGAIFSQFAEEYKKKAETEKSLIQPSS